VVFALVDIFDVGFFILAAGFAGGVFVATLAAVFFTGALFFTG